MNQLLKKHNQIKQQENFEKQPHALLYSSQTTTQLVENHTEGIQESNNALNKNIQKSIERGKQEYDEITNRNNQFCTFFGNSNEVGASIVKTYSNLFNDKTKVNLVYNLLKVI